MLSDYYKVLIDPWEMESSLSLRLGDSGRKMNSWSMAATAPMRFLGLVGRNRTPHILLAAAQESKSPQPPTYQVAGDSVGFGGCELQAVAGWNLEVFQRTVGCLPTIG